MSFDNCFSFFNFIDEQSKGKKHDCVRCEVKLNRPFVSCLLPLFYNEVLEKIYI